MDVFMPGMGGIEASRRIKEISKNWKNPPVIFACTADTSEKTLKECMENGIDQFLLKPLDKKAVQNLFQMFYVKKQRQTSLQLPFLKVGD